MEDWGRESRTIRTLVVAFLCVDDPHMLRRLFHGKEKVVSDDSAHMEKTEENRKEIS